MQAVVLPGAVAEAEVASRAAHVQLEDELRREGSKYGALAAVEVPAGSQDGAPWTGDVRLVFCSDVGARRALEALTGRQFGTVVLQPVLEKSG